jgi:hypothetical protein
MAEFKKQDEQIYQDFQDGKLKLETKPVGDPIHSEIVRIFKDRAEKFEVGYINELDLIAKYPFHGALTYLDIKHSRIKFYPINFDQDMLREQHAKFHLNPNPLPKYISSSENYYHDILNLISYQYKWEMNENNFKSLFERQVKVILAYIKQKHFKNRREMMIDFSKLLDLFPKNI